MPAAKIFDYCDFATDVRVVVSEWLYKEAIDRQYVVHPRSGWILWNYLKRIGLRAVITKVKSRLAEKGRNNKIAGIGIGHVLEASPSAPVNSGEVVLFFAPNHNPDSEVIVVDFNLLVSITGRGGSASADVFHFPEQIRPFVAWTRYSGNPIDYKSIRASLASIAKSVPLDEISKPSKKIDVVEQFEAPAIENSKPTAVLFGLGNYAKTTILPNIRSYINVIRVHEIDAEQLIFFSSTDSVSLDTSPVPRHDLRFDAWFIAGFHHTHSTLAIQAIRQGATAVIEKPLATNRKQYDDFVCALNQYTKHRFYMCFHKRYSKLQTIFRSDLGVHVNEPVDMHCIVYEIPLPQHHWYNWPNSGSRLISNGCHWIDYFMFVNDYCQVEEYRKWEPRGSDIVVQIKLVNGAYFSMTITDTGSQRLGVRDHVELRVGGVTVTMVDGEHYTAENRSRILRRVRVNPLDAYQRMYKKISYEITHCGDGDDMKSLRSSDLTLLLEAV